MNKSKTIADFVEERRARANQIESATGGMPNQFQRELIADLRAEADELETAWKREQERAEADALTVGGMVEAARRTHGNAAALREALIAIQKLVQANIAADEFDDLEPLKEYVQIRDICNAALAAPPRQCDVGTAEEQEERYINLKREHIERLTRCPAVGSSFFPDSLYWAQMPYKEGDYNGNK